MEEEEEWDLVEVLDDALHVEEQELVLAQHEEGEGQPEDRLDPLGQEAVHDPGGQDSGFRIQDSGFRIQDSGFGIQDSGFRIRDS